MQPNEPTGRSKESFKQSEKFVNSNEKDSTNKRRETIKRKAMEDRFKSTVNSPRRCPRCGRYLVSERDVYCSDECFQIVRKQRLEVLNKEEEDVVY